MMARHGQFTSSVRRQLDDQLPVHDTERVGQDYNTTVRIARE
jgi:hypothetical protein